MVGRIEVSDSKTEGLNYAVMFAGKVKHIMPRLSHTLRDPEREDDIAEPASLAIEADEQGLRTRTSAAARP